MKKRLLTMFLCVGAYIGALAQTVARMESELTEVKVKSVSRRSLHVERTVTVLSERGKDFLSIFIPMNKGEKLSTFSARMTDAQGREMGKLKKGDLVRSEYSHALAEDGAMLYGVFSTPTYPVVITYSYTTEMNDGFLVLPRFSPLCSMGLEVKSAEYRLTMPTDGTRCRVRLNNVPEGCVKSEQQSDGAWLYSIKMDGMKALSAEPLAPSLRERVPMVEFIPEHFLFDSHWGDMSSWNSYSMWIAELLVDRDLLPQELKDKLASLTAGCSSQKEKLAAVYKYLEQTTRYVSIQLGIGGFQPMTATSVYRNGYGDCKALTNYMKAMLREVGIESHYCIIGTDMRDVDHSLPAFSYFNHVILKAVVDGETVWVETTNPSLALGYVHSGVAGHETLVVGQDGALIERLPQCADSLNIFRSKVNVALSDGGSAVVDAYVEMDNRLYESQQSLPALSTQEQQKSVNSLFNVPSGQLVDYAIMESKDPFTTPCIKVDAKINCSHYCQTSASRLFVPLMAVAELMSVPSSVANRQSPICIDCGCEVQNEVVFNIPDGYVVESSPAAVTFHTKYGSCRFAVEVESGKVTIRLVHSLRSGRFAPDEQAEFRSFLTRVSRIYNAKVVLKKE